MATTWTAYVTMKRVKSERLPVCRKKHPCRSLLSSFCCSLSSFFPFAHLVVGAVGRWPGAAWHLAKSSFSPWCTHSHTSFLPYTSTGFLLVTYHPHTLKWRNESWHILWGGWYCLGPARLKILRRFSPTSFAPFPTCLLRTRDRKHDLHRLRLTVFHHTRAR